MQYPKHLKSDILRLFALTLCLTFLSFFAQAQLIMLVNTEQNGDDVTAKFSVNNFEDIVSMQFSINWDVDKLQFETLENYNLNGLTDSNFGITQAGNGIITFSWFDPNVSGITKQDGAIIFELGFQSISPETPEIFITNFPLPIEIIDKDDNEVSLVSNTFSQGFTTLSGNVFHDLNNNCTPDGNEQGLRNWIIKAEGVNTFYANTDGNGGYNLVALPGNYVVSLVPPNELWDVCENEILTTLNNFGNEILDFAAQTNIECPQLEIDISTPRLRRCFDNVYTINYYNKGTQIAQDAYIEITFDEYVDVFDSSLGWSNISGQTYTFQIGNVEIGEGGRFKVFFNLNCDADLGQSHCTTAEIFPQTQCLPNDPNWDGSSLEVEGVCIGDSLRFDIKNTGGDMTTPLEFVIIEDVMIRLTSNDDDPILLVNNETHSVFLEANGSTFRLDLEQAGSHPGKSNPTIAVEGCGTNPSGFFSKGFVTQFANDDLNNFIDIDCQENIGSYDPNDKIGYPKGFCENHTIHRNQDLEYQIRFQNTGTDTAFNIVIKDTLSHFLNPTTLRPGVSSHPYKFELLGEGVVQFTFENILLPDSTTNQKESNGFVKFKISQNPDLPLGTIIENNAAIYFDFNDPIITNLVSHTIGQGYVGGSANGDITISGTVTKIDGTPIDSVLVFSSNNCPIYTNSDGFYQVMGIDTFQSITLAPSKMDGFGECVTIIDLIKLSHHIIGAQPFTNAYQYIAGDINGSGSISTFDLIELRKLILGITNQFNNNVPWRFVDANYVPTIPITSWSSVVSFNGITQSEVVDWIGVNTGDVVSEGLLPMVDVQPNFIIEEKVACSSFIEVGISVEEFETVDGFQFSLKWDPDVLQFNSMGNNFGQPEGQNESSPKPGELNIAMVVNGNSILDGTEILTLRFNVKGQAGESTDISLHTGGIPFLVLGDSCALTDPILTAGSVTIIDDLNFVSNTTLSHPLCPEATDGAIDLEISGGDIPYSFEWNTGQMEEDLFDLSAGNYLVTVTENNGCELELDIILVDPDSMMIHDASVVDATSSGENNGAIFINVITGGTASYNYQWSNGETTPFIANISDGIYSVTITDSNGCEITETFEVGITTGINSLEDFGVKVTLQPNPVIQNQRAFLQFDLKENHLLNIEIIEPTGRTLTRQNQSLNIGSSTIEVVTDLPKGLYFIKISNVENAQTVLKMIVL